LALVHPAQDGDQQESEWVKDSLSLQSSLSRLGATARNNRRFRRIQYSDHTRYAPSDRPDEVRYIVKETKR
jgi:hypothetical protein